MTARKGGGWGRKLCGARKPVAPENGRLGPAQPAGRFPLLCVTAPCRPCAGSGAPLRGLMLVRVTPSQPHMHPHWGLGCLAQVPQDCCAVVCPALRAPPPGDFALVPGNCCCCKMRENQSSSIAEAEGSVCEHRFPSPWVGLTS